MDGFLGKLCMDLFSDFRIIQLIKNLSVNLPFQCVQSTFTIKIVLSDFSENNRIAITQNCIKGNYLVPCHTIHDGSGTRRVISNHTAYHRTIGSGSNRTEE